jgi:hypothetical protein
MSAGYIQLAAIGQQDAYLTGDPQVTYFSGMYRRHTPFVLEAYDIPFLDQQVNYGQNNICKIPAKGDLVRGLTLKLQLPALNNPGADWTWPTPPAVSTNEPYLCVISPATAGANTTLTATLFVPSYSTNNASLWLTTTFTPYVEYNPVENKFVFSNCASIEVENSSAYLASGVFFGFDPKAYTSINPVSGNLVYTVNSTSNLQANSISPSNVSANFISTVTRTSDFTLEQAGWVKSTGALPADTKTGLFTFLNQPYNVSGLQFLDFAGISITGPYWTTADRSAKYPVTTGGRIQFTDSGLYAIKAGFELGAGSMATFSYGSSTNESIEGGAPVNPNFEYSYTFRVSPDPSMPVVIPIKITNTANTYYFYVTSTGTQLQANSYISINPVDEIYRFSSDVVMDANPCRIQLYGNVAVSGGTSLTLSPNSIIKFGQAGEYLVTGVLSLTSGYVSNVSIWEGSNLQYDYDMSVQGRDPTFAFTLPVVVSDATRDYTMNITTTTTTTILSNSYFIVNRVGVYTGMNPDTVVLPDNGLTFQSNVTTLTSPFDFISNFTSNGVSNLISYTSAGLNFSNAGTFMLTGAVCTADPVTSITFGPRTYQVGVGLLPPYTFQVPLVVTDTSATYPVSVTVAGSTAAPNIFSNTFISVYPITSPTQQAANQIYSYYDSVGTWAIKTADLKIGGQTIQSLTGEAIELWNDLHVSYENQPGLQVLTGKNDTGTTINPPGRTYFVNLPFYFYGNPALYLPLVALGRHDVEVHVTFRNFSELTAVATVNSPTLGATIIVDYVYLSDPEINWFQRARLDYVITQCQYQTIGLLPSFQNAVFNLDLKNPVRELFFVVQPTNQLPYDYSNNAVLSFGLSFNGQEVFTTDTTDALYTGSLEPFNHYENFPQRNFFMYSFTTNTGSPKPHGQINFSRIKQVLLTLNCGGQAFLPAKELRITAVNYNILQIADGLGGLRFNT